MDSLTEEKHIFFASDQHFGAPNFEESKTRERLFLAWMDQIFPKAKALFLLGDLFDFWFDYKRVVPRGYVRVLSKIAQFQDSGIDVHFFVGNHDLWMDDYLEKELGIKVYHQPKIFRFDNKSFFVGHGDGLGPGDKGYKRMKKVFVHPVSKWLFRWLHPDLGVKLAQHLSLKNKMISGDQDVKFLGEDREWLIQFSKKKLESQHFDYFVFGHRHLPLSLELSSNSRYINLGDWISYYTYGVFDGNSFELKSFDKNQI